MPFDPTLPGFHAPNSSEVMRNQLVSLFDLIQAIPAGPPGPEGQPGAQGPPFAFCTVDAVFTVPFSDPAQVIATFDGSTVHFTFHIPQGPPGPQGEAGEVSLAQLGDAVAAMEANSSANSNGVATLDTPFADPDTEANRLKLNELIAALRR